MNARANRLARYLVGRGVGRERGVAVWMERSVDLIVALLAVVKAGGFYVPVHEGYPAERRRFVLDDSAAVVLLTDRPEQARVFCGGLPVVALGVDAVGWAGLDATDLDATDVGLPVGGDQLVYVMYTSGSSGVPKGVGATHRGVVGLARDGCWLGGVHERVLMHAPHAFDVSGYEVWVPLLSGGRVVLAPNEQIDGAAIRRLTGGGQVGAVHVTAGLFRVIAEGDPSCFEGVHQVLTGGDVVSATAVRRVLEACPEVTV
ncbi:AMP-binding protein, partial [Streptomyces albipurpureus]